MWPTGPLSKLDRVIAGISSFINLSLLGPICSSLLSLPSAALKNLHSELCCQRGVEIKQRRNVTLNITSTWCHEAPFQTLLKRHSGIKDLCRLMLPLYHDGSTVCFPPSPEPDTWCKTHWTVTLLPLLSLCLPSHPPRDVAVIMGSVPARCRLTDTMF